MGVDVGAGGAFVGPIHAKFIIFVKNYFYKFSTGKELHLHESM